MIRPLTERSTFVDLALFLDAKGMTMRSMEARPEGFVAWVRLKGASVAYSGIASTMSEAINKAVAAVEVS